MEEEMKRFMGYLQDEKHASANTVVSYQRDLHQLSDYMKTQGITDATKVTKTSLNSYILYLQKQGKATTTISRVLASVKAFFHYEFREGLIVRDPSETLKTPKIEKKPPTILTIDEVSRLMEQPGNDSPKELRDKAMLELLYATGIRVSELIGLKVGDINMQIGFITCRDLHKERMVPFGKTAKEAVMQYLEQARESLLKGHESDWLFTNCNGHQMSRQGFWKIIKYYGAKAGIEADITPHCLRHSFAAHLISGGADIMAVQTMMGHADLTTTQMYTHYVASDQVRSSYLRAHPRK